MEFSTACQRAGLITNICRILVIYVCLQAVLLTLFMPQDGESYVCMAFLLSGLVLALKGIRKRRERCGNLYYKRAVLSNGGRPVRNEVLFFGRSFLVHNPDTGNEHEYGYDRIQSLLETDNLLILSLDYRMALFVEKARISGGSYRGFTDFLLQKAENLKKKRIIGTRFGKWIERLFTGCAMFMLAWGLLYLSAMHIFLR